MSTRSCMDYYKLTAIKHVLINIKEEYKVNLLALPVFLKNSGSDISSMKEFFCEEELVFSDAKKINHPEDLIKDNQ